MRPDFDVRSRIFIIRYAPGGDEADGYAMCTLSVLGALAICGRGTPPCGARPGSECAPLRAASDSPCRVWPGRPVRPGPPTTVWREFGATVRDAPGRRSLVLRAFGRLSPP